MVLNQSIYCLKRGVPMFRETPDNGQMSIFEGLMFATDQTKTAVEASRA